MSQQVIEPQKGKRCERQLGFTLIEIILAIAVMAILAGALAPLAIRSINSSREDLTRQREIQIFQAIMGADGEHGGGFLSDIGRLPISLTELSTSGSLPLFNTANVGSVGMGWRGPYLTDGLDSSGRPVDAWGTLFDYGAVGLGCIRSAGADHTMGTSDDLIYPSNPLTSNDLSTTVNISIKVLDSSSTPPVYVDNPNVQSTVIYLTNNGMQSSLPAFPGPSPFAATLSRGIHAITVTADPDGPGLQVPITNTVTIFCRGGNTLQETITLR
jgi:prepilin-type N-terminal cleavage/methylation domain-containing protein